MTAYFDAHVNDALAQPDDSRLVIRAILDSDADARVWPLRPYLEKLTALAQDTDRWRDAGRAEVLAGLYRLIGAIQYFAISAPTLAGMFGENEYHTLSEHTAKHTKAAVRAFIGKDGPRE